MITNLLEYNKT